MGRAGASRRAGIVIAALAAAGVAMTAGVPHALKAIAPMPAVAAEAETLAASGNREPLALGARPLRVTLSPTSGGRDSLRARVRSLPPDRQIYLILQELRVAAATIVGFEVYFELPENAAPDPRDPHHVGNFNFFDAESGRRNAAFNITALARRLAAEGTLGDRPSVTIVPTGPPEEDAHPTIGRAVMMAVGS